MRVKPTWHIEVNRYFVPKEDDDGTVVVDVRKLYFEGEFIVTKKFKVNVIKRSKQYRFSVWFLPNKVKPLWPGTTTPDPKWVKEGSFSEQEFTKWLSRYLGQDEAEAAIWAVLTAPPENLAA